MRFDYMKKQFITENVINEAVSITPLSWEKYWDKDRPTAKVAPFSVSVPDENIVSKHNFELKKDGKILLGIVEIKSPDGKIYGPYYYDDIGRLWMMQKTGIDEHGIDIFKPNMSVFIIESE